MNLSAVHLPIFDLRKLSGDFYIQLIYSFLFNVCYLKINDRLVYTMIARQ